MTPGAFEQAIADLGLASFREEIQRVARPCLDFLTRVAAAPVPANRSKIGGAPDLPAGMEWPTRPDAYGRHPLVFLGRICAGDLSRIYPEIHHDLLFFADWMYAQEGCILAVEPGSEVFPAAPPPLEHLDGLYHLTECEVQVEEAISLPCYRDKGIFSPELETFGGKPHPVLGQRHLTYAITGLIQLTEKIEDPEDTGRGIIRCGGYPIFTQSHPMEGRGTEVQEWQSLMCFGDDGPSRLSYGDTGFCGFLVKPGDLKAGELPEAVFYQDNC